MSRCDTLALSEFQISTGLSDCSLMALLRANLIPIIPTERGICVNLAQLDLKRLAAFLSQDSCSSSIADAQIAEEIANAAIDFFLDVLCECGES